MASLLILAIGGTIAISTFTFMGSKRIFLDEQTEAYLIANNVLQTLLLYTQTNSTVVNNTGVLLDTSMPSGSWKPWVKVPAQYWENDPPNAQVVGEVSNSISGQSVYQWSYSLNALPSEINIKRSQLNHNHTNIPVPTTIKNLTTLTVAVRWSLLEPEDRRKRVLVSAIIPPAN